jgi:hypothetical protein
MKKWLTNTMIGLAVGAVMVFTAAPAQADYTYQIFDNDVAVGGVKTVIGTSFVDSVSTPNFNITIVTSFTSQASGMTILDTQLQAHEMGTGSNKIEVKLFYNNYTLPAGTPLTVFSSASANFTDSKAGDTATAQSWANAVNQTTGDAAGFNKGTTQVKQTGSSPGGDAFGIVENPNPSTFAFDRTNPMFTLAQDLSLTLTNDTNTSGQNELVTTVTPPSAVPAPAGLVLVLTGMPVLAFGGWVRRRWLKKA